MQVYTVGTIPIPQWCRDVLMQYIKTDGSTGWEFQNKFFDTVRVYQLLPGDVLICKNNGSITINYESREKYKNDC